MTTILVVVIPSHAVQEARGDRARRPAAGGLPWRPAGGRGRDEKTIYIYIYIYIYICIYLYTHIYIYVYTHIELYIYKDVLCRPQAQAEMKPKPPGR